MFSHPGGTSRQVLMSCILAVVEDSGEILRPKKNWRKGKNTHIHTNSIKDPVPVKKKTEIQNANSVAEMIHSSQQPQVREPEEVNCAVAQ